MNSSGGGGGGRSSLNTYEFDFGFPSGRQSSRPLKDQKPQSTSTTTFASPSITPSWTPNKPSWTHQPAPSAASTRPGLPNQTSMVGDIFGKSWASSTTTTTTSSSSIGIGIPKSNPNLFGDLVGTALGQGRSSNNVPLKSAAPAAARSTAAAAPPPPAAAASARNTFSMGNLSDSLPKNTRPINTGPSLRATAPSTTKTDPFASFVDFGSKPMKTSSVNHSNNNNNNNNNGSDHAFGDFQKTAPSVPKGTDPFEVLFTSSTAQASGPMTSETIIDDWNIGAEFGGDDAGMDGGGTTTELEGLPPPPSGINALMAKNKGLDNYKQGQYPDAIKWLSWAVALLEKGGDNVGSVEVLTCRASSYKEVGEYKKAIADCTKVYALFISSFGILGFLCLWGGECINSSLGSVLQVLEHDSKNVSVLLQRALLYESSEKYKLGAEDLRAVLKLDPNNRLAKSTIHRLVKLSE
ncbi:hypothetical protein QJS04_geneDACA007205 [Acorus gramineus]|uniref:Uncharacterized protein n=1 Tax=Acorus gramineus TaxID=55184 RepID=A0AAV9BSI3_ACOGR|nr:hypothetical protein QJS04_geneDACA007205 [Acorus gramineus]